MGDFEEHYTAGRQRFPVASLWLVVPVYMGTDDPTLVVVTLVLGSLITRAGAVVPDIDSHDSIPRRKLGRLLTVWVLVVFFLTSVDLVVPGPLLASVLSALPVGFTPSALLVLLLLWTGLASRHRSMTHSIVWGAALSVAFGATGFFTIYRGSVAAAVTVGAALAAYCFVGFYSHLDIDDEEDQMIPSPDEREFDGYEQYVRRWTAQYRWLTVPALVAGLVVTESGLGLLAGLALVYCGLIAGLTLPSIDRKRSEPRRVFDLLGVGVVTGLLLQQLLATGTRLLVEGAGRTLALPSGTVPAFYLFLLVLWLGREGNLLQRLGLGRVTHTLHWPGAVCASFVLLLVTGTAGLPRDTTVFLAVVGAGSMLYGFYHHFRVDDVIANPDQSVD
ncbi:hypothetical protein [Halolamina sediminis]|jgi:hypothetical protein|uniref:hypothetical protein n=1 Tax=Halolamina sediminis TaxID=1480675 RepID=UPI0006B53647|nr:hypothetical protein [Halolamina sediminis]